MPRGELLALVELSPQIELLTGRSRSCTPAGRNSRNSSQPPSPRPAACRGARPSAAAAAGTEPGPAGHVGLLATRTNHRPLPVACVCAGELAARRAGVVRASPQHPHAPPSPGGASLHRLRAASGARPRVRAVGELAATRAEPASWPLVLRPVATALTSLSGPAADLPHRPRPAHDLRRCLPTLIWREPAAVPSTRLPTAFGSSRDLSVRLLGARGAHRTWW